MIGFSICNQIMHTDLVMHAGAIDIANCSMCQAGTYQTRSGPNESALVSGMELPTFTRTLHSYIAYHNSVLTSLKRQLDWAHNYIQQSLKTSELFQTHPSTSPSVCLRFNKNKIKYQ